MVHQSLAYRRRGSHTWNSTWKEGSESESFYEGQRSRKRIMYRDSTYEEYIVCELTPLVP